MKYMQLIGAQMGKRLVQEGKIKRSVFGGTKFNDLSDHLYPHSLHAISSDFSIQQPSLNLRSEKIGMAIVLQEVHLDNKIEEQIKRGRTGTISPI